MWVCNYFEVNGRYWRRMPTLSVNDTNGRFAVYGRSGEMNAGHVKRHTRYGGADREIRLISTMLMCNMLCKRTRSILFQCNASRNV
jgi:hypothetical protein